MKLIYVNEVGVDYKGEYNYEFIFSNHNDIYIDEWFTTPAVSAPFSLTPPLVYINFVGILKNFDFQFDLLQKSEYFSMNDGVDGIISLAWEKYDDENENTRLFFNFGDSIDIVVDKLDKRGYKLLKEEIKITNEN